MSISLEVPVCTEKQNAFQRNGVFFLAVESGPEELGLDLKFVNQIEAMSASLKLNQLAMTDIWTLECSNRQIGNGGWNRKTQPS